MSKRWSGSAVPLAVDVDTVVITVPAPQSFYDKWTIVVNQGKEVGKAPYLTFAHQESPSEMATTFAFSARAAQADADPTEHQLMLEFIQSLAQSRGSGFGPRTWTSRSGSRLSGRRCMMPEQCTDEVLKQITGRELKVLLACPVAVIATGWNEATPLVVWRWYPGDKPSLEYGHYLPAGEWDRAVHHYKTKVRLNLDRALAVRHLAAADLFLVKMRAAAR